MKKYIVLSVNDNVDYLYFTLLLPAGHGGSLDGNPLYSLLRKTFMMPLPFH